MTISDDPTHPAYVDEADVRDELTRVFDVCLGCRRCDSLCGSFVTLFEMVDRFDDHDPGRLTPAEQDRVVDECFQCTRCSRDCPFTPDLHELAVDVPRLVLRAQAMRNATGQLPTGHRLRARVLARAGVVGRIGAAAGSLARALLATRTRAPGDGRPFSTWFGSRAHSAISQPQGRVAVFPTCVVELEAPGIGQDLVGVCERNRVECTISTARCCGAPLLHAGDVRRFTERAEDNVAALAADVRSGAEIVVLEPSCSHVLKHHYPSHVAGSSRADAALVAAHTYEAADYLMRLHRADGTALDTQFTGDVPDEITYHVPCHSDAGDETATCDLLELTGARVTALRECAGGACSWRTGAPRELAIAQQLAGRLGAMGGDLVVGGCARANGAIAAPSHASPIHPISLVARAYGATTRTPPPGPTRGEVG